MNTATKVVVALVVILVIAAGAYFMLQGTSTMVGPGSGSAMNNGSIPEATGSVDDFATAMEAELSASAAAIKAFDTSVDASVSSVTSAADTSTLYDPSNI
jgi:hypothetical protein